MIRKLIAILLILLVLVVSGCIKATNKETEILNEKYSVKNPVPDLIVELKECSYYLRYDPIEDTPAYFQFLFNITVGNSPTRYPSSLWISFEPEYSVFSGQYLFREYQKGEEIKNTGFGYDGVKFKRYWSPTNNENDAEAKRLFNDKIEGKDFYFKLYYCEYGEEGSQERFKNNITVSDVCLPIYTGHTSNCKKEL